jgi:hypothetical protein
MPDGASKAVPNSWLHRGRLRRASGGADKAVLRDCPIGGDKFFDWIDLAELSDRVTTPRDVVVVPDDAPWAKGR